MMRLMTKTMKLMTKTMKLTPRTKAMLRFVTELCQWRIGRAATGRWIGEKGGLSLLVIAECKTNMLLVANLCGNFES
eukprot:14361704-Ditylum_brightwellii.AAC.1